LFFGHLFVDYMQLTQCGSVGLIVVAGASARVLQVDVTASCRCAVAIVSRSH